MSNKHYITERMRSRIRRGADIDTPVGEYTCTCGEVSEAIPCDSGIGPYEFWGEKANQRNEYWGTQCCEVDVDYLELFEEEE